MDTVTGEPIVLLDQPEDECCADHGWVQTTVSEDRARDLLAPYAPNEYGDLGDRPEGPARKVWLRVTNKEAGEDDQRWHPCDPSQRGAVEFWEVDVSA